VDVFGLRDRLVTDYADFTRSFINIRDDRISGVVEDELRRGLLWPDPLIQLNPGFEPGDTIDQLVDRGVLHPKMREIFRRKNAATDAGQPLRLHRHQSDAIHAAQRGASYVLSTGTGSGKSLGYFIPIADHIMKEGPGRGIRAIVVYPMNALANSQGIELEKFLSFGFPNGKGPITFRRYTGQEKQAERDEILAAQPDVVLTNYSMLELILTRPYERRLVNAASNVRYLVLDEFHTYRGRQGADVALLVRRVKELTGARNVRCVGTSATLASTGTKAEQRSEIARVATMLFGETVAPMDVIAETLQRSTPPLDLEDAKDRNRLAQRVGTPTPTTAPDFLADPLASWIESTFGVTQETGSGELVRATPRALTGEQGAAAELAELVGAPISDCVSAIAGTLATGCSLVQPESPFPIFAFRVHQFFSRGESVYASTEVPASRYITTREQVFVPGDREKVLLPVVFCRECGQDYYVVASTGTEGRRRFAPRDVWDLSRADGRSVGFLCITQDELWPSDEAARLERVPEEWLELGPRGEGRVRRERRADMPQEVALGLDGSEGSGSLRALFLRAPFRFCLRCGVAYGARQTSDAAKLSTLGSGGRSSATSLLVFSALDGLRKDGSLEREARKLLSFTDNRQDASLQAGHFNDFIQIGLLRSALYRAAAHVSPRGLAHDELARNVTEALALPIESYARDPSVKYAAREETDRALRDVIGYRLYRDLERGWRITAPNLEQTGMLRIEFQSLDELVQDEHEWAGLAPPLSRASAAQRSKVARVILDHLRRELAIHVDYLKQPWQDSLRQRSSQHLVTPWGLDEDELLTYAGVAYPRPRTDDHETSRGNVYLSARGGVGQLLRRPGVLPDDGRRMTLDETQAVIVDLLKVLQVAGLVTVVNAPRHVGDVSGYQLSAAPLRWVADAGERAYHDPVRVPRAPADGLKANRFFVSFYKEAARSGQGMHAREHTAQVPADQREEREEAFREARLPILFCSPTMELGVDIRELNVVNMRNVPPTPANYAQRSGRAGRNGRPALVFNYASIGSPHDQYFFRRPHLMVKGQVRPPRLDLTNEDLVRAHVHALWLAHADLDLGSSLAHILELDGDSPSLQLKPSVRARVDDVAIRQRALASVERFLETVPQIRAADWFHPAWAREALEAVGLAFEAAFARWRDLYRAASESLDLQDKVIRDATRASQDRDRAKRLRSEAEAQLELLRGDRENERSQSDFYSYRYFASEGFLPGYAFPRLPLSAFIPGRGGPAKTDQYLSRPRFVAISEFGPRSIIYHEGSRYVINKVILPPARTAENRLRTQSAKQCGNCGYLHPVPEGEPGPDLCEHCSAPLPTSLDRLFRLQNVSTRRRERINSDEEERQRTGFEVRTGLRFAERGGRLDVLTAEVRAGDSKIANLTYGTAATIWRINVGRRRREDPNKLGFVLDTERGYWENDDAEAGDPQDPMSKARERVIPYVEDRRNALLLRPSTVLSREQMASLGAAFKNAVQLLYELEDQEIAVEPLPSEGDRRELLFFEAAEGGAGVLRQLSQDPQALSEIASKALELCHYDPSTGEDRGNAPGARERCEAACYDCLLSYGNQRDHELLDRAAIRERLMAFATATASPSPVELDRDAHLGRLQAQTSSGLERRWLDFVMKLGLALPTDGQVLLEAELARPDFVYRRHQAAVFVDGPVHSYADVAERDKQAQARLEDAGYLVIRFPHDADWVDVISRYPNIFGKTP
jgi:hypothetical protein